MATRLGHAGDVWQMKSQRVWGVYEMETWNRGVWQAHADSVSVFDISRWSLFRRGLSIARAKAAKALVV
jgi:hypothetical protein